MKKLYLFLFKILAWIEVFSGKAKVWSMNKLHEVDYHRHYKPHKKYMRGDNEKIWCDYFTLLYTTLGSYG